MTLLVDGFPEAHPGQFVHLTSPPDPAAPLVHSWPPRELPCTAVALMEEDLLTVRRAYSIAGLSRQGSSCQLQVVIRVAGRFTRWLSQRTRGDRVSLLGPLGNHFTVEAHHSLALLVAGGVGLPPMIFWSEALARRRLEVVALCGARSADLLALQLDRAAAFSPTATSAVAGAAEFAAHGCKVILSTDDGSLGYHGTVAGALERYLRARRPVARSTAVYTCGPEAMMRNVCEISAAAGIECQVCMERSMACGMGTCQSCVVATRDRSAPLGWHYRLCCTEGPIFDGCEVLWDGPSALE